MVGTAPARLCPPYRCNFCNFQTALFIDTASRSRRVFRASFANNVPPSENRRRRRPSSEGAGKTGCALHPRSRVPMHIAKRTRAYRFSGSSPAFPVQWFYDLLRALPGETRLVCHRRRADTSAQLDTSHWGVRTTRLRRPLQPRSSVAALASTAPRPNVSDDGQRPSLGTGWRRISR